MIRNLESLNLYGSNVICNDMLLVGILKLSDRERKILNLRVIQKMKHAEIADLLGLKSKTVEKAYERLMRGLSKNCGRIWEVTNLKNFKKLLMLAKMGDKIALREIVEMYSRLITKESVIDGIYDDDMRQILFDTLLSCIRTFNI